jgi:hypothetical protein
MEGFCGEKNDGPEPFWFWTVWRCGAEENQAFPARSWAEAKQEGQTP